jgi:NitT/TauT family transport system substrate-binding protein
MIQRRIIIGRRGVIVGVGAAALSHTISIGRSTAQTSLAIRCAYSAPGLSFSALFLANRLQLWGKNGLNAELKQVQGDQLAVVALTNNEAELASVASIGLLAGWEKGVKTLAIGAFTGSLALQVTARKDWLSRVGVSLQSKLEDKLKALKGARIGAATVAGGPTQYMRYLLRSAGIDPDQDVKILPVGFGPARMAALRTNQVDVTIGDAPEADQVELEGFGELFLNCGREVSIFKEFPYTVAVVSPRLAEEKPDLVRRIAASLGQANNMFATNFGEVVDALKLQFPNVPAKALERALERDRDVYPRDGRMTATMWKNNIQVALETKMISSALSEQEGQVWTNKFQS